MCRASTLLSSLILPAVLLAPGAVLRAETFEFVTLGDTAYNLEKDLPVYERLIASINDAQPAFSIHVGDTWGALPCTEENHRWIQGWFDKFAHPLIYTPGDNEWTDCRKPEVLDAYIRFVRKEATAEDMQLLVSVQQLDNAFAATSYADTVASLATIRKVFFARPESQGQITIPLTRQADVSDFDDLVENVSWQRDGVHFATVSVPGSQMGFMINDPVRANEAVARNRANVEWIKSAFAAAEEQNAKAVVIVMHASIFMNRHGNGFAGRELRGGEDGPFYWVALAIRDLAERFGRPVLLIHGDFHEFVIDPPFLVSQGESAPPRYGNITRLQVYGAPELRAVKVGVDTDTPWVFDFSPLYVE